MSRRAPAATGGVGRPAEEDSGVGEMTYQLQREIDFRRLKDAVTDCWSRLKEPDNALVLLREAAQQFIGWRLQDKLSIPEMLEQLERAAVLSPNAVGLLSSMCEMVGCAEGSRLVANYQKEHPPVVARSLSGGSPPTSSFAALRIGDSDPFKPDRVSSTAYKFTSDFDPAKTGYKPSSCPASSELYRSANDQTARTSEVLVMTDSRASSERGDMWRTTCRSEQPSIGVSSGWPPLESVQYERLTSAETEESRQRSMALWGHTAPIRPSAPPMSQSSSHAVCECYHPHVRPAAPRRFRPGPVTTVEQALNPRHPTTTSSTSSNCRNSPPRGIPGVTPSGARRARLVDFLSKRLGPRYQQLGEHLVTSAELSNIVNDTGSDLVSRARRVLHLYLSRHSDDEGDVELALVRRLRRIRFNRLADELEQWGAEQDRWEDPRDWPEDKVRHKEGRNWPEDDHGHPRHGHPSPVRIPRMACC